MNKSTHTAAAAALNRTAERPPILEAARSLGLPDRRLAELLRVSTVTLAKWASGRVQIPRRRHVSLIFVMARLLCLIGKGEPATKYARRSEITREAAEKWLALAKLELAEETGGVLPMEDVVAGAADGYRMVVELERQS